MSRNLRTTNTATANVSYSKNTGNQEVPSSGMTSNPASKATAKDPEYESAALKRKSAYKHGQPLHKRRRTRGGGVGLASGNRNTSSEKKPAGLSSNVLEAEAEELADNVAHQGAGILGNSLQEPDEDFDPVAFDEYFGLCAVDQVVIIRAYAGDEDDKVLEELRPRYVILYDPDPSYIRRIEVSFPANSSNWDLSIRDEQSYRALHPLLKVQTYFMMYANSAEEQRYLSYIRRERESFERLIKERSVSYPASPSRRALRGCRIPTGHGYPSSS